VTFRRVQELLAARSVRGTRERKHPHYLKGPLYCGVWEAPLHPAL